jgi:CRP-like cAMP-binding protein
VSLHHRQSLYESGQPIKYAYFLEDGVGSVTDPQADGDEVEIGLCGRECSGHAGRG